ncbi:MAG: energy-coupled thiamine transporter ThiT [Acholeplasmatales bacterium]|nr:energy-coupled thiamine transporter ThiT [Acholeplasmatales bacterium]
MKKFNVRVLAEIAIFAAIGFVLDVLQGGIWKSAFPNGGSIGFAMIPVFIICYRRGFVPGILCGLILSIVQMLGGIYVINSGSMEGWKSTAGPFVQVMLDYVLGYTVCGFAGCFAGLYHKSETKGQKLLWIIVGCSVGSLLKYASHTLSGCFFWPGEMWGVSGYAYSFLYNGLYCIPNWILCTAIMVLVALFYPAFINASDEEKVNTEEVFSEDEQNKEVNE